jgi:hypothetical protein
LEGLDYEWPDEALEVFIGKAASPQLGPELVFFVAAGGLWSPFTRVKSGYRTRILLLIVARGVQAFV